MSLNDTFSLYDILEISSSASPQEVREAYHRTKTTYSRSNVALYSIVSAEEREDILKKIEEAYFVLSNPERRKEYDSHSGDLGSTDSPFLENTAHTPEDQQHQDLRDKVISIDRVPPMESGNQGEDMLIPPSTEIPSDSFMEKTPVPVDYSHKETPHKIRPVNTNSNMSEIPLSSYRPQADGRSFLPKLDPAILHEIEVETEWKGSFLKKIREAYKMPLEEMIGITKVSRTYIIAIEDENFAKLPAPVYIRASFYKSPRF